MTLTVIAMLAKFCQQVIAHPHKVALAAGTETITYLFLDQLSSRPAAGLLSSGILVETKDVNILIDPIINYYGYNSSIR